VHDQPDDAANATRVDRLSWAEIRRLALHHKKSLWIANGVAVLALGVFPSVLIDLCARVILTPH